MFKNSQELAAYFSADKKRLDFLAPLLPLFVDQINTVLNNLLVVQKHKNSQEFTFLIHQLKGTALTYGALPILKEVNNIEHKLRQTEEVALVDLNGLQSAIIVLNKICEK